MTTEVQKAREMNYAMQLAGAMDKNWEIEFPPNESEWPDLLIHDGTQQFGLEIREKQGKVRSARQMKAEICKRSEH